MKKKAFTLAEVLITLTIVGVVSILTVPNIVEGYKKKVYVGQLQRTYNILANAIDRYMVDTDIGTLFDSNLNTYAGIENFLRNYMKSTKFCGNGSLYGCLSDYYKRGYNTTSKQYYSNIFSTSNSACITLNTGSTICVTPNTKSNNGRSTMTVVIDVNGKGAPNAFGRDAFILTVDQDQNFSSSGSCSSSNGLGCFKNIMDNDWKMTY